MHIQTQTISRGCRTKATGDEYIFTREKYNSVCVDSRGQQFDYGTIRGEYPPIDTTGSGCSTACVKGISVDKAKGCNQRPPSNRLVGFQYDCESTTCKCLYEAGTLGNQYSQCFDDMNTSNHGSGQVYSTKPQQGQTCYSLHIQSNNPPPSPTPSSRSPTYEPTTPAVSFYEVLLVTRASFWCPICSYYISPR